MGKTSRTFTFEDDLLFDDVILWIRLKLIWLWLGIVLLVISGWRYIIIGRIFLMKLLPIVFSLSLSCSLIGIGGVGSQIIF